MHSIKLQLEGELEQCSDAGWVGTVDKDLGFNFLMGVVTVMN